MFDPNVNVNFVVALMAEAKPYINRLKLQPESRHKAFKVYVNDKVNLVVSGIGRNNAAAAAAYLGAHSAPAGSVSLWLNVGIAGHKTQPMGAVVVAHKVIERALAEDPGYFKPLVPTSK